MTAIGQRAHGSDLTCPECHQPCNTEIEDQGLGWTEFQGVWERDVRMARISTCCGALIEELHDDDSE